MSDDINKPFDPTESTRTLTAAPFKETYMTLREHQDTDKHYIGDSLPVPSLVQMRPVGTGTSVGVLPFPARVDHIHDTGCMWGFFNSAYMTVAPGNIYINNLAYSGWGRDMRASGQIIVFPVPGLYFIQMNIQCGRQGGGAFVNEVNFVNSYNNGTSAKTILRQSNFDIPGYFTVTMTDYAIAVNPNDNIQFAVQHNDTVNWDVGFQNLYVTRVASLNSS